MKRGPLIIIFLLGIISIISFGAVYGFDPSTTTLTFVSPIEGSVITIGDSIVTEVSISDDTDLDTINISLYDSSDNLIELESLSSIFFKTFSTTGLSAGDYYINATANDTSGNLVFTDPVLTVTLVVDNPPTISSLTSDVVGGMVPLTIILTATAIDDNAIDTHSWNLGNGTVLLTDGATSSLTVRYTDADASGVYTITLTVNDSQGQEDSATIDVFVIPNCGTTGTGEVCISVPQDMCSPSYDSGLGCDENAARRYCKALGYDEYVSGSKNCDVVGSHSLGSWATDGLLGACGTGADTWILSMKCYGGAGVPGTCTDTDETSENPYFSEGTADDGSIIETDTCEIATGLLTEYFCEGGLVKSRQIECSEGCGLSGEGACKVPEQGLFCSEDDVQELLKASPMSRQRNNTGALFYCGLNLVWYEVNPTVDDISCIEAGTCPSESACLADYECVSNSCVDEYCISITQELLEQRSILDRIFCFLTNMGNFFGDKLDYCGCLYDPAAEATDYNACVAS